MNEPEQVTVYTRYEWDCPACGETTDEGDIEPSGSGRCPCGQAVTFS